MFSINLNKENCGKKGLTSAFKTKYFCIEVNRQSLFLNFALHIPWVQSPAWSRDAHLPIEGASTSTIAQKLERVCFLCP